MTSHIRLTPGEKQQRYRDKLRSQGLRSVQIWVPDATREGFARECRRQVQRINRARGEAQSLAFIEDIADWGDE